MLDMAASRGVHHLDIGKSPAVGPPRATTMEICLLEQQTASGLTTTSYNHEPVATLTSANRERSDHLELQPRTCDYCNIGKPRAVYPPRATTTNLWLL
ncbi:hypothetical protein RRG08_021596 [Elysia crispata]|uniref:Uncharacterized protein n=1 Tax=Elysia crispata TaxID=231223 RepID=A0AAE1CEK7_9GAST|nr:hypothetical protein RRG08_021596 [Elysia crispata]